MKVDLISRSDSVQVVNYEMLRVVALRSHIHVIVAILGQHVFNLSMRRHSHFFLNVIINYGHHNRVEARWKFNIRELLLPLWLRINIDLPNIKLVHIHRVALAHPLQLVNLRFLRCPTLAHSHN